MNTTLKFLAFFFTVCAAAPAQVAPAATGPGGLPIRSNLSYSFRYSQTAQFGNGYNLQTAAPSASVGYVNGNQRLPFSMDYAGGYNATIAGPSYESGLFQRMLLTQGIIWRRWNVHLSDDVSYLPQAPTTGFSGIPGIGEPIGTSNPTTPSSQTILTLNTHVVDNVAAGDLGHTLNYATSFSAGGGYELLRYPNGDGLDTNTVSANAALIRHMNARNSIQGSYRYTLYSYPAYTATFRTDTALFSYRRQWSRKVSTDITAGPQWITSTNGTAVPSSTNASASGAINYKQQFTSAGLEYFHGTNGGAGYLLGAEYDTVSGNFSRTLGLNFNIGLTGGYMRTSGLNTNGVVSAKFGGVEATRRFGRNMIVFANYTGTDQSSNSALPGNALNQLLHVIGFGFGYSPRETHLRQ